MSNQSDASLTREDLRSVVYKLNHLMRSLSPGEQDALNLLLQEAFAAATSGEEVQGYDLTSIPLPEGDLLHAFGAV